MNWTTISLFALALLLGAGITAAVRGGLLTGGNEAPHAHEPAERTPLAEPVAPPKAEETPVPSAHAGHEAPEIAIEPVKVGDVIDLNNATCPIMGGKAQKDVTLDYQGVRVHFCCPGCDADFKKDPEAQLKRMGIDDLDAFKKQHGVSAQAEPEPVVDLKNETCPVMGGKAQEDVTLDYQGVRIHFCCPGCDKTFEGDPEKYLKKLGIDDLEAFKKQRGAVK